MSIQIIRSFAPKGSFLTLLAATILFPVLSAKAQCPPGVPDVLISGLRTPLGITQSNQNNLIVSETGTLGNLHSGRISIVEPDGTRRTLVSGLPSATNDVSEPSGPAGVFMRGRTLYVLIGIGDAIFAGPFPGTAVANPNPSSPLFSSVLALHFSANVEKSTTGFALSTAQQQALAGGAKVTLSDGSGKLTIELVANFPNFTPNAPPPGNVRGSNPFDLVAVGNQLYVTDGGQNSIWQVDIPTGTFSTLVTFPTIPNPLPPPPPIANVEAVPTGITYSGGQLLVALLRGAPFPPGESDIEQVDPLTGSHSSFIGGLTDAIDVAPIREGSDTHYLVLQHASTGPFFAGPGVLLHFETPAGPPTTVSNCLTEPTSMVVDEKTGLTYVTELAGRIIEVSGAL